MNMPSEDIHVMVRSNKFQKITGGMKKLADMVPMKIYRNFKIRGRKAVQKTYSSLKNTFQTKV